MTGGDEWPEGTPEAAVINFLAAAHEEDWAGAAAWIDLHRGIAYAEERRRSLLERPRGPLLTTEEFERLYPHASTEVIQWHVARAAEAVARRPNDIAEVFAGVETDEAMTALDSPQLVRALLEAADIRYQMRLTYAAHGYALHPAALAAHQRRRVRVIGHLEDGPGRALVVFREIGSTPEGDAYENGPEVIEVTRSPGGRWGLPLDHQLTGSTRPTVYLFGSDGIAEDSGSRDP